MSSESQPLISVIMPVYNGEKYLHEAVESILAQTLADFELIVIDDGSTDRSAAILESFRQNDARVIVQHHSQNQGIVAANNTGLAIARGKYIARMDADDISLPERFEKQAAYLEKHPEIEILGSAIRLIDERGQTIGMLSAPRDDLAIRWTSLFSSPFMQPTIMFHHSVVTEHALSYRGSKEQAEDFDFSIRLLEHVRGFNLTESLYIYRVHPGSVTSYFNGKVYMKSATILANLQEQFPGLAITYDQVQQVAGALLGTSSIRWKRAEAADTYLRVWQAFSEKCSPDPAYYQLKKSVALIAAKMALYPPFQPGWRKALQSIHQIEPDWLVSFIRKFPEMVFTKYHSLLIRRNRK
jgi:hypothetical protein